MLGVLIDFFTILAAAGETIVSVGDMVLEPVKMAAGVVKAELAEVNAWMAVNTSPVDYSKMNG